ncbi:MAG: hypothetical protein ACYDB1_04125 [Acidiferrobacteraceae bacterium]
MELNIRAALFCLGMVPGNRLGIRQKAFSTDTGTVPMVFHALPDGPNVGNKLKTGQTSAA